MNCKSVLTCDLCGCVSTVNYNSTESTKTSAASSQNQSRMGHTPDSVVGTEYLWFSATLNRILKNRFLSEYLHGEIDADDLED